MNAEKRHGQRLIACTLALIVVATLAKPAMHLIRTTLQDTPDAYVPPEGYMDDASRMNQTQVAEVWHIPIDAPSPEKQLAQLLRRARTEGLRVSLAGARHSMGEHTLYPGGIVIDILGWNTMTLDAHRNILTVQAGALWTVWDHSRCGTPRHPQ